MSRVFKGSSVTARSFTAAPSWVLVVSTRGASDVTSTVSCAAPTCITVSMVTTWLTSTVTPRRKFLLKPRCSNSSR